MKHIFRLIFFLLFLFILIMVYGILYTFFNWEWLAATEGLYNFLFVKIGFLGSLLNKITEALMGGFAGAN